LPETSPDTRRTQIFSLYNLQGSIAASLGALCAGFPTLLQGWFEIERLASLKLRLVLYALLALATLQLFLRLSSAVEVARNRSGTGRAPLHRSRRIVLGLSALFGLDSLAGGFVVQSLIAFWFFRRWGVGPEILGPLFLAAGLLQATSYLVAAKVAGRIGLLNTMVYQIGSWKTPGSAAGQGQAPGTGAGDQGTPPPGDGCSNPAHGAGGYQRRREKSSGHAAGAAV
jgi:hypothetical protein